MNLGNICSVKRTAENYQLLPVDKKKKSYKNGMRLLSKFVYSGRNNGLLKSRNSCS